MELHDVKETSKVMSYGAVDDDSTHHHTAPPPPPTRGVESMSLLDGSAEDSQTTKKQPKSYWTFVRSNYNFQLYIASYILNRAGEWLTYLASFSTIETIQMAAGQPSTSGKAISRLVIIKLLPNVLLCPFGGVLADGMDRRKVMIALDLAGAACSWLFILAAELQSIPLVYLATFLQECLSGLYEPSRSAIIPLLVNHDEDDMQKATTISNSAWSVVAALASSMAGFVVGLFGIRTCFLVDSATYVFSAFLMTIMGGKWNVASGEQVKSWCSEVHGMITDGIRYIRTSFFGPWVLMKASGCLVYGGFDVLNISFAEERGSVEGRPFRLGVIFAAVGVGCLICPGLFEHYVDMSKPRTLEISCLISLSLFVTAGGGLIGFADDLWTICALTVMRAIGSSGLWIYSSLLLQKFSEPGMLGRITAIEYSLALLAEATTAHLAGVLQDDYGLTAEQVCFVTGIVGIVISAFWWAYHFHERGAF